MAYRGCPSYEACSCNHCPLDTERLRRVTLKGDLETKCRAWRSTREKIAQANGIPGGGLTERDKRRDRARALWEALPEEERQRRLEIFKEALNRKGRSKKFSKT